jgi:AbrB family looped-hinge helix DNA binding protein
MAARHVRNAPGGRVVIPSEFRKALELAVGDDVVIELKEGELHLRSLNAAIRRVQDMVRRYVPEGVSLADELIRERRAEAARDVGMSSRAPLNDTPPPPAPCRGRPSR